jgi:hypothetical protein
MIGVICGVKETGAFQASDGKEVPASVKFTVLYTDINVEGLATQEIGLNASQGVYALILNKFRTFSNVIGQEVEFAYSSGSGKYAKLAQFDILTTDRKPVETIGKLSVKVFGKPEIDKKAVA